MTQGHALTALANVRYNIQRAYIRLANLDYVEGNLQAARTQFEKSGITAQQCALVDAKPIPVKIDAGSFPQEELRWGLGGWTIVEFDISPEGIPQSPRTVSAFPPLVFSSNAEQKLSTFRYQQTYRTGGTQGCVGNRIKMLYDLKN